MTGNTSLYKALLGYDPFGPDTEYQEVQSDLHLLQTLGIPEECVKELKDSWGSSSSPNIDYHRYCYRCMYDVVMALGVTEFSLQESVDRLFLANNFPIFWAWAKKREVD